MTSQIILLLLSTSLCVFNGLNIAFNTSYLANAFNSIIFPIDNYLSNVWIDVKNSFLLTTISCPHGEMYLDDEEPRFVSYQNGVISMEISFKPYLICYTNPSVSYFYMTTSYPGNIYITSKDYLLVKVTAQVKFVNNQLIFSANSPTYSYPTKGIMSSRGARFPFPLTYYSSWVTSNGIKVLNKYLTQASNQISQAVVSAVSLIEMQFDNTIYFSQLILDSTILTKPQVINNNIISIRCNGTIYSSSFTPSTDPTSIVPVYDNAVGAKNYQYIISKGLIQAEFDNLYNSQSLSFADSYIFSDVVIYNLYCAPIFNPIFNISAQSNATILYNASCSVKTDVLGNFSVNFSSVANISIVFTREISNYNSISIAILDAKVVSYSIIGNPNFSYTAFINHFGTILTSMGVGISGSFLNIPLPSMFGYVLNKGTTYYRDGYAVIGE